MMATMKRTGAGKVAILSAGLFILLAAPVSVAQTAGDVVKAKVKMASKAARQKSVIGAAVLAEVTPGYHINDHHPSLNYLIPTEIKLDPPKQIMVQNITYPQGKPTKFAFSDAPLSVYEGTVRFDVLFQVDRRTPPGDYKILGQLTYQACNDHACLPPASVPLEFSFQVTRAGAAAKRSKHHATKRTQSR